MIGLINRGRMPQAVTEEFDHLTSRLRGLFSQILDTDGEIIQPTAITDAWIDVPFVAANFTGSGSMVWTVEPADVVTLAYKKIGSTVVVAFILNATTLSGVAANTINIALPPELTSNRNIYSSCMVFDGGTWITGRLVAAANYAGLAITKLSGNFTIAADSCYVNGQITYEARY